MVETKMNVAALNNRVSSVDKSILNWILNLYGALKATISTIQLLFSALSLTEMGN